MRHSILALVLSVVCIPAAYALDYRFLQNSFFSKLSEQDTENLLASVKQVLSQEEDKKPVFWQSSAGYRGKIDVQFSYKTDNTHCRRLRLASKQGQQKSERYHFDVCMEGDQWKIAATPATTFDSTDWKMFEQELQQSLNGDREGEPSSWSNPNTGVGGTFVSLNSKSQEKETCSDVAISIYDKYGRTSDGKYRFCRSQQQIWQRKTD